MTQRTLAPSLRFRNVSIENGLPHVTVTGIRQDPDGYTWLGTYDGLARYDGYEFTPVREKLPDLTVTRIEIDPQTGDLWAGTAKGLARVNTKTREVTNFSLIPKGAQPAETGGEPSVLSLAITPDSTVWVGTNGYGLVHLDPKTGAVEVQRHVEGDRKHISFDTVTALLAEKDKLWVGTGGAGIDLFSIPSRTVTSHYELSSTGENEGVDFNLIKVFYRDSTGHLWVGTGSGLARLDEKTSKSEIFTFNATPSSPSNDVNDILEGDGGLWVATNRYLHIFDPKRGTSTEYAHDRGDPQSLPAERAISLFRDHENVFWVGTMSDGFGVVSPLSASFAFYNIDIRSYLEDASGRMWIGTPSEICRTERPHTLSGTLSCYEIGSLVRDLYEDENGLIWGGTLFSGLFRFDPRTALLKIYGPPAEGANPSSGPSAGLISKIYGTRQGLWLATFGGGLNYFDKNSETFHFFTHNPSDKTTISSDNLYTVVPAKRGGGFWLATDDGVNRFDPKAGKVVATYRQEADKTDPQNAGLNGILTVYEADDGALWVGTYGGGLLKIEPTANQTQRYVDRESRGRNSVFGVLPDEHGMLWLSTEGGISEFDPKKGTFEHFYPADGLQGLTYTQSSKYQDTQGRMYMGGIRGVNVFRPSDIKRSKYSSPIVLRRLQLDGKDVVDAGLQRIEKDGLSLAFNHKVLALDFAVLSYLDPDASQYMYRIDGIHDWIDIGTRHFVTINTLPSGTYTIHIRGKSRTGMWNEDGVKFRVKVSPPPWRTWWAYVIYGLMGMLMIGVVVLRQRAQIQALHRTHRLSELEREMQLTSAIQEGFLPLERSVRDGVVGLEGFYRPAAECGGDWWSYEARGDNYFIVVGDATGHGAGSAMVTAASAACFRSLAGMVDDDARLQAMNEEVLRVSRGQYHMTLTAVVLNIATGEFTVLSAGGVPLFTMAQGRPKVLMCPGTPLGSEGFEVGRVQGRLMPGDRMLLLTDGLPEVSLANSQLLGPRGVANFFQQTSNLELGDALQRLVGSVEAVQSTAQDDDWTAVMVQWGESQPVDLAAPTYVQRRTA